MHNENAALSSLANHPTQQSMPFAGHASAIWEELEQISLAGHVPAHGYQGHDANARAFTALRHYHGRLIVVSSGLMNIAMRGRRFAISPGSAIWVPPLIRHRVDTRQGTIFNSIFINFHLMRYLPATPLLFSNSSLLEHLSHAIVAIPEDSAITKRSKLLAAILIDEIAGARPLDHF
ncbi:cupin domain-containing protein [Pseudomonas gingeri]|uniref:hypothetical protein n=1 Tax=Pseudomonas gingeri TaxID=117681 RepID=UPI0015A1918C|nr:hypothetical protein [Pseudomonas gingeri]NVZ27812.1 hypothetical protein [Pseudomonas gingeri]NWA05796.1 hypothetical protein [Pseudomonas gingeri]